MSTSARLVVNFSFQEATYVNHDLVQSNRCAHHDGLIRLGHRCRGDCGGERLRTDAPADTAKQAQVSSPAPAIQSILNNGMTSVANNLSAGVTNTIGNAVNNQLIQRVITANIGTTGLSQTIQQNVASTVAAGSCCVLAISVTLRRWPMSLNGRPAELHEMKS